MSVNEIVEHRLGWRKPAGHWDLVCLIDPKPHTCLTNFQGVGDRPSDDDGDNWGPWFYNKAALALELRRNGRWAYDIDLERCRSLTERYEHIIHVSEKTWLSTEDLGYLVRALVALFNDHR